MSFCQSRDFKANLQQMVMGSRAEIEELHLGTKHSTGSSDGSCLPGFDVFVNSFDEKNSLAF